MAWPGILTVVDEVHGDGCRLDVGDDDLSLPGDGGALDGRDLLGDGGVLTGEVGGGDALTADDVEAEDL